MAKYIGFGIFSKKYIFIIISYIIFDQTPFFILTYFIFKNSGGNKDIENKDNNISLIPFLTYFGQSLFLIPELIIQKIVLKNKNNSIDKPERNSIRKSLAIEYIFNDEYSETISSLDIVYIIFISLLILIIDIIKITLHIQKGEDAEKLVFNDEYNFLILIFLFLYSIWSYKTKFYKHQYCPFIFIIIIGLIRYIIKVFEIYVHQYNFGKIMLNLLCQIIIGACESFTVIYAKGLMKYKYFSPYKACYIFGIIDGFILLIILLIISNIKCNNSFIICSLEYNGSYYIDNIKNIIEKYKWYQFILLFFCSIFLGAMKVLINITINNFSIFYIYLLYQIKEFIRGVFEQLNRKTNKVGLWMALSSYIPEFFCILVFLEIIELKFCDLNTNLKNHIEERSIEEIKSLNVDNEIVPENQEENSNDDDSDENNNNIILNELYNQNITN